MIKHYALSIMIALSSYNSFAINIANDTTQSTEAKQQSASESSDASTELQQRLNSFDGYKSNFVQVVRDIDGNIIHEANGRLVFKQPGKFIWEVTAPEEELLISNGTYVWWFNPFVEQVSIFDVKQAVTQTPFALLVSKDLSIWNTFNIVKQGTDYIVTPKDESQAQVVKLKLVLDQQQLQKIIITSRSQQVSEYTLSEQSKFEPNKDMFEFEIPAGVDIDDQRQSLPTIDGNVSY